MDRDITKGPLYTEEDRRRFATWYRALKLPELTLEQTMAEEVAVYFGKAIDEVVDMWFDAEKRLEDEWHSSKIDSDDKLIQYYNTNNTYIYELSYWHTKYLNLILLENVRALEVALECRARSYLDFGGGIGSNVILFHQHGFNCTLADISDTMLNFAAWRFRRRRVRANLIDLKRERLPAEAFDFVTAIAVLEHVPDPIGTMHSIVRSVKPGGTIMVWIPFFEDHERSMHISRDLSIADEFTKQLGILELSRDDGLCIRYYRKI